MADLFQYITVFAFTTNGLPRRHRDKRAAASTLGHQRNRRTSHKPRSSPQMLHGLAQLVVRSKGVSLAHMVGLKIALCKLAVLQVQHMMRLRLLNRNLAVLHLLL